MTLCIDLNADLGELPGADGRASDAAILAAVTSCAIACGGHAGDDEIMEVTLRAAQKHGVFVGAHPSYPDRKNFGRHSMEISPKDLHEALTAQMQKLYAIAKHVGVPISHVKPHGALYNDAAKAKVIAITLINSVKSCFGTKLALIGPPGQETEKAAKAAGLSFHAEGFMDRTYLPDKTLMPRSLPGAVLHETEARLSQARNIVLHKQVIANNGKTLDLSVQTLCLHGDSPDAVQTAHIVKQALEAEGVVLKPAGGPDGHG
jgi:UPF0271 protein